MTPLMLMRVIYAVLALGLAVAAHLIIRCVLPYQDGRSHLALLSLFRALRFYWLLIAASMGINIACGVAPWGSLILPSLGSAYLLYALIRFLKMVRGW